MPENKVGAVVVMMSITDDDDPHSPAWNAKFKIIDGDPGGLFNVTTGTNKHEGVITTVKVGSNTHRTGQATLFKWSILNK